MIPVFLTKALTNIKVWLVIAVVGLAIITSVLVDNNRDLRADSARVSANYQQIQNENFDLKLTRAELKDILEKSEKKTLRFTDSIIKANKINVKAVTEINNLSYHYKDSTVTVIPLRDTIKPVSIGDARWGFSGVITNNNLVINNKWASTEIAIIKYMKPKKILFIRIGWKEEQIKAFSETGDVAISTIKIVKERN